MRVVGATHQDLRQRISDGLFREDLYYRLAEVVIDIPPLRDRVGDAVLLCHSFAHKVRGRHAPEAPTLTDRSGQCHRSHRWPGNVRELQNVMKRAVIMCEEASPPQIWACACRRRPCPPPTWTCAWRGKMPSVRPCSRPFARADGNIVRSAELLGVSRPTLYDLMNRLQIK